MYIKTIKDYKPKNEQEKIDKEAMLEFARINQDSLSRENKIAHFTSSAIITNKAKDKILFVFHLIYKSWGWVGGHNDLDPDFLKVAIKEAKEETGLKKVTPLINDPIALDNIYVEGHIKNGSYVGDHIHMNLTYLFEADEDDILSAKVDENSGVKWFMLDNVLDYVTEEKMIYIYEKIFKVLKSLK